MAIWISNKLTDSEGYSVFFAVKNNLEKEFNNDHNKVSLAKDFNTIEQIINSKKVAMILAVEDARILENDLSRLDILHSSGVRILTLNWSGITCIGGAHNTNIGLTDFGVQVVKKCFDLGIIPDISHCSFEGAKMTLELAKIANKPIIASHSDSYKINPHTRNLKDEDFLDISRLSGLVGINLCPEHLSNKNANIYDVIKHTEHYLSLGGENTIAMGSDLDGTSLPSGFTDIRDIEKIANEMQKINYSNELIDKIMFKNAYNFFTKNI